MLPPVPRWVVPLIAAVVLMTGAVVTVVLLNRPEHPKTASALVDAYLTAVGDGELDTAVGYWHDDTTMKPSRHEQVAAYLRAHRDGYRRALGGGGWSLREFPAAGTGTGVEVSLGPAKETYIVTPDRSDDGRLLIFFGPEFSFGVPDADGNALIGGA
jgi:hypothetical protein